MTSREKQTKVDSAETPAATPVTDSGEGADQSSELTISELEPRIAPLVVRKAGGTPPVEY